MSWVAAGVTAAGLVGAYMGSEASRKASNAQAGAADRAAELQWQMYQQQRQDASPWRNAAIPALDQLRELVGNRPSLNPQDVMNDPGYQFALEQGNRNVTNNMATRGGMYSGAMLRALQKYGQGTATQFYDQAFNRQQATRNNQWGELAQLAGIGQTANQQIGQAGQNAANAAGQFGIGAADANAANRINQANIWGSAANTAVSAFGNPRVNQGAWQWGGVNGSNDMGTFSGSGGNNLDWWSKYGSGGD